MIEELKFAIDEADRNDNKKAKEILLKIASFKEENQESALALVKIIIDTRIEGENRTTLREELIKRRQLSPDIDAQLKEIEGEK